VTWFGLFVNFSLLFFMSNHVTKLAEAAPSLVCSMIALLPYLFVDPSSLEPSQASAASLAATVAVAIFGGVVWRSWNHFSSSRNASVSPSLMATTAISKSLYNGVLDPLNPHLHHPRGRTGKTKSDPILAFFHFKFDRSGYKRARLVKPGKLTPLVVNEANESMSPYDESYECDQSSEGGKIRKHRHIASYTRQELDDLKWDGAMYNSLRTCKGLWVPFVSGYDSDPDFEYEEFDSAEQFRQQIVGLPRDEVGCVMKLPTGDLIRLQRPTAEQALEDQVSELDAHRRIFM
jgi:hypothetical protein